MKKPVKKQAAARKTERTNFNAGIDRLARLAKLAASVEAPPEVPLTDDLMRDLADCGDDHAAFLEYTVDLSVPGLPSHLRPDFNKLWGFKDGSKFVGKPGTEEGGAFYDAASWNPAFEHVRIKVLIFKDGSRKFEIASAPAVQRTPRPPLQYNYAPIELAFVGSSTMLANDQPRPAVVRSVTLQSLCKSAQIMCRVTIGNPYKILLHSGQYHYRTLDAYYVGLGESDVKVPKKKALSRVAALRVLEVLAHGMHDYGARECVCKRGLFVAPKNPQ